MAPVAILERTPNVEKVGIEQLFTACKSYDDQNEELIYAWFQSRNDGDFVIIPMDNGKCLYSIEPNDPAKYTIKVCVYDTYGDSDCAEIILNIKKNGAPWPEFSLDPQEGDTKTHISFDASETKDDFSNIDEIEFRWDWESDGEWDTPFSTENKITTHLFTRAGIYSVSLQTKDADTSVSYIFRKDITIISATNPPKAKFVITPDHGNLFTEFKFDASSCFDFEDPSDMLEIRWDWENDGVWDIEYSTAKIVTRYFDVEGFYDITLQVKDTHGNTDILEKTLIVTNCIDAGEPCPEIPHLTYMGQAYNTVQIGSQCWIRENMNVGQMILTSGEQANNWVLEKYCYENNTMNCEVYGGLYQWDEAMQYSDVQSSQGICPDGWHIPSHEEWVELSQFLGGWQHAGQKMKSCTDDWVATNQVINTNESSFTGLPSGEISIDASSDWLTYFSYYWASTTDPGNSQKARYRALIYNENRLGGFETSDVSQWKNFGFSVRCVKNP